MGKRGLKGGKIATPIREMLDSVIYNGVVFKCNDDRAVETVRMAALMLKKRNGYEYHTTKRDKNLVVYKGCDTDEPMWFDVLDGGEVNV